MSLHVGGFRFWSRFQPQLKTRSISGTSLVPEMAGIRGDYRRIRLAFQRSLVGRGDELDEGSKRIVFILTPKGGWLLSPMQPATRYLALETRGEMSRS